MTKPYYLRFKHRKWNWPPDKQTWIRVEPGEPNKITVHRTHWGAINPKYEEELEAMCDQCGIEWWDIDPGETFTTELGDIPLPKEFLKDRK